MYITVPTKAAIPDVIAGRLAVMTTPKQGNILPPGCWYAADNGRFGKGWPGAEKWWAWLESTVARYGAERCLFATAPDVVADPVTTLAESLPWLPRIRELGVPAAFVAQDGCENGDLIPWGSFDVLFIGGSTDWKLSPTAACVAHEAKTRGLRVHMGRVNSRRRVQYARAIGCDSVDGTRIAFGPDLHLVSTLAWMHEIATQPTLFEWDD